MVTIEKIDCLQGMRNLKDDSINLIITSPPYNVGKEKHNPIFYNSYIDSKSLRKYLLFLQERFCEAYRILTPDGRIAVNIGAKKNGRQPLNYFVMKMMEITGFKVFAQIIWSKGNTSRNSAFGSYLSPSCPSFITTFEYILVFYKKSAKLLSEYHKTKNSDLTKEEFVKGARSLWEFPGKKHEIHPAAFPLELPLRLIKMLTYPGDMVLDPFAGIGTVGDACKLLNRDFLGFEIDSTYVKYARKKYLKKY